MATSLDGEPLETSQHYIVKMVTVAENTGQRLLPTQPGVSWQAHLGGALGGGLAARLLHGRDRTSTLRR